MFQLSPKLTLLPVIHGSGDFAVEVRRILLETNFDCLAVPLPESFQSQVEDAVVRLPEPSIVIQRPAQLYSQEWSPDQEEDDEFDDDEGVATYVPIDPCQGVVAAIRTAMGEHIPRRFIDLETVGFDPYATICPDPFALKKVSLERFSAAMLPVIDRPASEQRVARINHMTTRLRELEMRHNHVLHICSMMDWPWLREAYQQESLPDVAHEDVNDCETFRVDPHTLMFLFGELPFITGLYERARAELEDDQLLSIDGVKEMLLAARDSYRAEFQGRARRITPLLLRQCLKYLRNLCLVERRMTPDLYSMVVAAKQIAGDQYALHVAEIAREYAYTEDTSEEMLTMGIEEARLPDGSIVDLESRLPGAPLQWRSLELKRRPEKDEVEKWKTKWNPYSQCSWPPEDELIENFRAHVFDRALAVMGADLATTEKFTTSVKDGIDIRDTLRHWYEGEIYVKVLPPNRGTLDAAVMLFDSPADPRDYPWRTTWFAEHDNESTLAFFASDFHEEPIGPGICLARYGGALFLFPPVSITDIWLDPRLDFTETMEERVLAAACLHSQSKHIALVSALPPGAGWRQLAKRFGKSWVHIPMGQFSQDTIQQLRLVHVLNGQEVRSYAADFIRRA